MEAKDRYLERVETAIDALPKGFENKVGTGSYKKMYSLVAEVIVPDLHTTRLMTEEQDAKYKAEQARIEKYANQRNAHMYSRVGTVY